MEVEPLAKDLIDDRKGGQIDEALGLGSQRRTAFERADLDAYRERLDLTAADRFSGSHFARLNGGRSARSASRGESGLAGSAPDCDVLSDYLPQRHHPQDEEQEDEGDHRPLHHRLARRRAPHGEEPGWKRSIVWTH